MSQSRVMYFAMGHCSCPYVGLLGANFVLIVLSHGARLLSKWSGYMRSVVGRG